MVKILGGPRRPRSGDPPSPRLPWDLVFCIIEFVPQKHLPPILYTCHFLRQFTEKKLYSEIDLTNAPNRSIMLFQTLLTRPELASHVKLFRPSEVHQLKESRVAKYRRMRGSSENFYTNRETYFTLYDAVVQKLTNVEAVCLWGRQSSLFVGNSGVLLNTRKFKILNPYGFPAISTVLDGMPGLTHLSLPFSSPIYDTNFVNPIHAPDLEEFIGPARIAEVLVPGRPLKRLFVHLTTQLQQPLVAYDVITQFARGSGTLTHLGLGVVYNWREDMPLLLHYVSMFLPDVEELYLQFKFLQSDDGALRIFLDRIAEDLEAMKSLRVLDFNGSSGRGFKYWDSTRTTLSHIYTTVLDIWKARCPTLEKVVLPNGSIWVCSKRQKWSCKNPLTSRRNRMLKLYGNKVQGADVWSSPMFTKDLKREWPDPSVLDRFIDQRRYFPLIL